MNKVIGSQDYFGECLRLLRKALKKTPEEWGRAIGKNADFIHELEFGKGELPTKEQLIQFAQSWEIPKDMVDDLVIAAGYVPDLEFSFSDPDAPGILTRAIRELLRPTC